MHSIWTVLVFVVFIGIVLWAFSGRRKKDFDEAARLVLDDDQPESNPHKKTEE
jgi:cytochrome c oxidase cbb3-type subunit 4